MPTDDDPLSDVEMEAMDLTSKLARLCRTICGNGPNSRDDWAEFAVDIHNIQHRIMAQAAVRAFPDRFRPLGGYATGPPA